MKSIPTSFDFDGQALRPDHVVKCSYGNDSIALIQFLHEYNLCNPKNTLGKIVVLYNDTGWSTAWWPGRVTRGEAWVRSLGFIPARTDCKGMEEIVMSHGGWPDEFRKFCTAELKILPTLSWLWLHDPEGKAVMVCGVRREESERRKNWPWFIENGIDEGRSQWSPLVLHSEESRNGLIRRAGWIPLPHRSRECRCINANSSDLKTWSEADIADVEKIEVALQQKYPGKIKFMFHPKAKAGNPEGIRQVIEWAKKVKPRKKGEGEVDHYEENSGGCDSGYCSA
jgi:3'-phosphoadenosine 5'-phosphosulfate sulfotransferase (PAPS reductase)/FAD synthetase